MAIRTPNRASGFPRRFAPRNDTVFNTNCGEIMPNKRVFTRMEYDSLMGSFQRTQDAANIKTGIVNLRQIHQPDGGIGQTGSGGGGLRVDGGYIL